MGDRKACHNCRRRRLRCDRSLPACLKCTARDETCHGYGQLFRWVNTKPTLERRQPGHSRGITLSSPTRNDSLMQTQEHRRQSPSEVRLHRGIEGIELGVALADPLTQDLSTSSRYYMYYYISRFCQDLVVHDSAEIGVNPFRELIPMSQRYSYLQHIVVAVSAIHYHYAIKHSSQAPSSSAARLALIDALRSRQEAIKELIAILSRPRDPSPDTTDQAEQDALLATVLFFVNYALIDSGKDGWRDHLSAAGVLLSAHCLSPIPLLIGTEDESPIRTSSVSSSDSLSLSSLIQATPRSHELTLDPSIRSMSACDFVASDTVSYFIWNYALDSLLPSSSSAPPASSWPPYATSHIPSSPPDYALQPADWDISRVMRILSRTEANSYHSCPAELMGIVLRVARLTHARKGRFKLRDIIGCEDPTDAYISLLREAQDFDVQAWALNISAHHAFAKGTLGTPIAEQELSLRHHIAATYRAAVCLYILLVAPDLPAKITKRQHQQQRHSATPPLRSQPLSSDDPNRLPYLPTTEDLATTILQQLSFVPKTSPFFKFTTWPVFLTGMHASTEPRRAWVTDRLSQMRDLCPWGMLTSAMETLVEIWALRDGGEGLSGVGGDQDGEDLRVLGGADWLARLEGLKIDCLIV
ncbi:fungal-specific transcription factor domain-containing protein [Xylariaceae sp. FL0255]|nr:fungal-specific transcription factor domain-containing protein [Xylariaceae sp. FL0255]